MKNLLGAVLCGGQSKRMGRDKGLLMQNNKAWAVCIAEKLEQAGLEVVISINPQQETSYLEIFPSTPLLIDQLLIEGPLNGLLSIHRNFPEEDVLLMACDFIDMDQQTILHLIEAYRQQAGFEYYVYQQNGFTQPFCAVYTARGLAKISESVEQNQVRKYSLHDKLESGNTLYLPVLSEASFRNYNRLNGENLRE